MTGIATRYGTIIIIGIVLLGVGSSAFAQKRKPAPPRYTVQGDVNSACVAHPNPTRPTKISGGILNSKALELPKGETVYDELIRKVRGTVSVHVLVGEDGRVIEATGVSGDKRLRPSAVTAARLAKFKPTLLSGSPVKVSGIIYYKF